MKSNYYTTDLEEAVEEENHSADACECLELTELKARVAELETELDFAKANHKAAAKMLNEQVEIAERIDCEARILQSQVDKLTAALDNLHKAVPASIFIDEKELVCFVCRNPIMEGCKNTCAYEIAEQAIKGE